MEHSSYHYQVIARAIDYIGETRTAQPGLEQVAEAVGMSPAHFQRIFSQWVGVSPKRYQQYLSLGHAKDLLQQRHTVFDATLELEREGMTGAALTRALLSHPLMTLKVATLIYWQALRLWAKRTPFFTHPSKLAATDIDTTRSPR